jgi:hypothetical protein
MSHKRHTLTQLLFNVHSTTRVCCWLYSPSLRVECPPKATVANGPWLVELLEGMGSTGSGAYVVGLLGCSHEGDVGSLCLLVSLSLSVCGCGCVHPSCHGQRDFPLPHTLHSKVCFTTAPQTVGPNDHWLTPLTLWPKTKFPYLMSVFSDMLSQRQEGHSPSSGIWICTQKPGPSFPWFIFSSLRGFPVFPIMASKDAQVPPHLPPLFVYSPPWSSPSEALRDLHLDHINAYKPSKFWALHTLPFPHRATSHLWLACFDTPYSGCTRSPHGLGWRKGQGKEGGWWWPWLPLLGHHRMILSLGEDLRSCQWILVPVLSLELNSFSFLPYFDFRKVGAILHIRMLTSNFLITCPHRY